MISWNLIVKDTVNSTNDYLKELGKKGAPEGTAILARWQIAGRGRMDHTWHSPHGLGLYLSWLLRPPRGFAAYELMGVLVGVPAARVVRRLYDLDVRIKWPNDLMVGQKKLGGILGETVINSTKRFAVLGLGINLRQHASDFPSDLQSKVTSLVMEGVVECDAEELARAVLESFQPLYTDIRSGNPKKWMDEYKTLSCTIGSWQQRNSEDGVAVGIGAHGELLVARADGKLVVWEA